MNWLHHCLVAASQRSFKYTRYCSASINLLHLNNIPVICFGKVALFKSNISYPLHSIINTRWPFFFCATLSSLCSNMHPMEKYICYPPSKTDEGQAVNLLQLFVFPARSLGMGCFVSVNVVSVEVQPFQFINIWECKANHEKKPHSHLDECNVHSGTGSAGRVMRSGVWGLIGLGECPKGQPGFQGVDNLHAFKNILR